MSMRCMYRWAAAGVMATGAVLSTDTQAQERWHVPLNEGERTGLTTSNERLEIEAEAPAPSLYQFSREGHFRSSPRALDRPVGGVVIRARLQSPASTAVLFHVRGQAGGRWQPWEKATPGERLRFEQRVSVLQVRVILHGTHERSPSVEAIDVELLDDTFVANAVESTPTYRIFATREGLAGHRTANGHRITRRDRFVALPSWRVLNEAGERDYQVRITYRGRSVVAPVWDVGPWNTHDDYWSSKREMWPDLPRGMPQAQAARLLGYNRGRDEFGRRPNLPNGIDLADGTFWDDLGMSEGGWVEVTFLWMGNERSTPPADTSSAANPRTRVDDTSRQRDTTPPIARVTRARRLRSGNYFVRWSATDSESGVTGYDIQVRRGVGGKWQTWLTNERAGEGLFRAGPSSHALAFRVRARDKAGNQSDYSAPVSAPEP